MSRVIRIQATYSESMISVSPELNCLNAWFGKNCCADDILVLRARGKAASAIAAAAKGWIVPRPGHSQWKSRCSLPERRVYSPRCSDDSSWAAAMILLRARAAGFLIGLERALSGR